VEVLGEEIQKLWQPNRLVEFEMSVGRRRMFLRKKLLQLSNCAGELVRPGFGTMKHPCIRQCDVRNRFRLEGIVNDQGAVQRQVFDQEADNAAINLVLDGFIEERRYANDERLWGRRSLLAFGAICRE
jgi:hypothetical protein